MDASEPEGFEFKDFQIPESFLEKLHEFSGSTDGNRGFILAFVTQSGRPAVCAKADNQVTDMGLRKALEVYLEECVGDNIIYPED
jgi:hypothetical protein